jgi:hypothetical protein
VVRADGVIPSRFEMAWLFGDKAIERIDPGVALPSVPWYYGSAIIFRNIGQHNDVRALARNGKIINGLYYYLERL